MKKKKEYIQGSLFEDGYLMRSLNNNNITKPDVALTEIVANAWDAGAMNVNIFIPDKIGGTLFIEDDGVGLTKREFYERWMKLRYDRLAHQGKDVIFPNGTKSNRTAYGRNGIGRHGLLCFNNDEYKVITSKKGKQHSFNITTKIKDQPFAINSEEDTPSHKQGTRLEVVVNQNLPNIDTIRNIISSRFLFEPEFKIEINRVRLTIDELDGKVDEKNIETSDGIKATVIFLDTTKSSRKSYYQGIAFWQKGRLVGNPSWILGQESIIDGRSSLAKRYSVIVRSDAFDNLIKEDWSGFKDCEEVDNIYKEVTEYANEMFTALSISHLEETKKSIKEDLKERLQTASPLANYEVDEIINNITISSPKTTKENLKIAVEAFLNLETSKSGQELILKLSRLETEDIDGLNEILDKWTVKDALTVLTEINRRITIIEAIRKLSEDSNVDELHVLHPLVTEARWLFGPEYDTVEYTSNRQLQTVVKELFKGKIDDSVGAKIHNRPDIVILSDNHTFSVTGTETYGDNSIVDIDKILIIELKRGGFNITRDEREQTSNYVEDLQNLGYKDIIIKAFVVGQKIDKKITGPSIVGKGEIIPIAYSKLVDTAERRMFGLRQKLSVMYDNVPGMELYRQTRMTL